MANDNTFVNNTLTGTGTFNYPVNETGDWVVEGWVTLPNPTFGDVPSSLVVTVGLNGGSAFFTSPTAPKGFKTKFQATQGNTINVTLAVNAANTSDNQLNAIKTSLTIYQET